LALTHPDHEVWLQSYYEEKSGIEEDMGTFQKKSLGEFRALCEKGAPKAIPTMCVLTIKKDEQLMPLRAKSRIIVLGNRETHDWSKSDRFAPVLRLDSLRFLVSMLTQHRRPLKQGDCLIVPGFPSTPLHRQQTLTVHLLRFDVRKHFRA
jgi:hypothetical protein